MAAQKAFMSALLSERQKSWNKTVANYEQLLKLIYETKWKKELNKEKLRLLLFECHFHCAVALQNCQNYQEALRHFRQAMEVVSWRKDECQAGCITGRVLHLHVPTLARMACCCIHRGDLRKALKNAEEAILLDFRNPDLFCIRSVVNFLLRRQDKALSDASFAITLNPTQVCGWLLRGLFKKLKKEESGGLTNIKQEPDLDKACEVNPDAIMFVNIKNLLDHLQPIFDRFLPSVRVSHTLSANDVMDIKTASTQPCHSSATFVCGVAKTQTPIRTCCSQETTNGLRFLERFHSQPSISHHKQSLICNGAISGRSPSRASLLNSTCKSCVPRLTLRDVVNTRNAFSRSEQRFIGIRDHCERKDYLLSIEDIPYLSERMYSRYRLPLQQLKRKKDRARASCFLLTLRNTKHTLDLSSKNLKRKWLQDRIPTKIPDIAGCRKLP